MPDNSARSLQDLSDGLTCQQAGRLDAAAECFQRALVEDPDEPLALYLRGSLALRVGRPRDAEAFLEKAVSLRPEYTEARFAYANALYRAGARAAAEEQFRALLERCPDHVGALVNLSNCLREDGDGEGALARIDAALALAPELADALATRGAALLALGRQEDALISYRAALKADATHLVSYAGLAATLLQSARPAEALAYADAAILLSPEFAEAHFLRAMALVRLGAKPAAIAVLRRVIARDPGHAKAHLNLANLLVDADNDTEAEALYRRAIALDPELTEAYASLAYLLTGAGRLEEAVAACDEALAIDPGFVQARWNQGIAWLLAGNYEKGWPKYEVRMGRADAAVIGPAPEGPLWRGESLRGKTIVVVAEQGLGDTIQFARYLPLLAVRGASVTLVCDRTLVPFFQNQLANQSVIVRGSPLPPHDCWVSEMSLPFLFATRLDNIPSPTGYLRADQKRVASWQRRLPRGPRIGLVWAGNPHHSNDARRSMRLAELSPLFGVPGVTFVSLQVGKAGGEADGCQSILDFSPELTDFAETAALIETLDLVVSVDTSSAHCAAAIGKETWVMLPRSPDWRWLLDRADSPWYAAVRLFRQPHPGDWPSVVAQICQSLRGRFDQPNRAAALGRGRPTDGASVDSFSKESNPERLRGWPIDGACGVPRCNG